MQIGMIDAIICQDIWFQEGSVESKEEALDEYKFLLSHFNHVDGTNDVWKYENGDEYYALTLTLILNQWNYSNITLVCSNLETRHKSGVFSIYLLEK